MSLSEIFMRFGWPIVQIVVAGFLMALFRRWMTAGIGRDWIGKGDTFAGGGFMVFALMGLYLVILFVCSRHELFDEGIHFNGPLTCRRTLRWRDMTSVPSIIT